MQQHVAVGVGDEAVLEGDPYPADRQVVTLPETMNVEAVTDSQRHVELFPKACEDAA